MIEANFNLLLLKEMKMVASIMLPFFLGVLLLIPNVLARTSILDLGSCHHLDKEHPETCVHFLPFNEIQNYDKANERCTQSQGYLPKLTSALDLENLQQHIFFQNYPEEFVYFSTDFDPINKNNVKWSNDNAMPAVKYEWKTNTMHYTDGTEKFPIVCYREFLPKIKCDENAGFLLSFKSSACFGIYTEEDNAILGRGFKAHECHELCLRKKSQPAVFDSEDDMKFVVSNFNGREPCIFPGREYNCGGYWTGHRLPSKFAKGADRDLLVKSLYNMDGSPVNIYNDRNFNPWGDGEPNYSGDNGGGTGSYEEHCIEWKKDSHKWNDLPCDRLNGCLCRTQADRT